jgi:hypothetical protein
MTLGMQEALVKAIQAYIEPNLAAKLAALNTEYPDAMVLEDRVATVLGIKSLRTIPQYPVLYIISGNADGIIWAIDQGGAASFETRPNVSVGILVIDQDQEQLQIRLYRYARALTELLLEAAGNNALVDWNIATDQPFAIDTDTGEMSRITDSESTDFVGEVSVTVRANKRETK